MNKIEVFCPATVANISCGFDVLGLCLETTGDHMAFYEHSEPGVMILQNEGPMLPTDPYKNVAGIAALSLLKELNSKKGVVIEISKKIKPGSGIGSSAASAAGAAFGVNQLFGAPLSPKQLIPAAMQGEALASGVPHADNVAPALLGGITLIRSYDPLEVLSLHTPKDLFAAVIHPQIELRTADARSVLKSQIPMEKAIRQWGNLGALVAALYTEDYALLGRSLHDEIVEPMRSPLIPGYDEAKQAAMESGALGSGISGSGPSIFALCKGEETAARAGTQMQNVYNRLGVANEVHISPIAKQGTHLIK
ncbi:homoserine kinase [Robertkochia sediminum]|uniref:homoserine kinase n=1 Tax=Robertkochia sediminum TaxID=2785326 RepID=UPI0019325928|nr:homoserine kinase [Robertkochia sediminum]MBL7474128.1 homoserine kinase [Robertkochia sediminum]